MRSARVNKAAILQRRQYLDPRVQYVQLNDQRKIKTLATSNGYLKPTGNFSHDESEPTFVAPSSGTYYISTDSLFKTIDSKFYILKRISTTASTDNWYKSMDGTTWTDSSISLTQALYISSQHDTVYCLSTTGTSFTVPTYSVSRNFLRVYLTVGNVVLYTYEEVTPIYLS